MFCLYASLIMSNHSGVLSIHVCDDELLYTRVYMSMIYSHHRRTVGDAPKPVSVMYL